MQDIYVNVPFVGEALFSTDDGTRGRTYLDGSVNARSIELWAGPCHLTLDRPARMIPRKVIALVGLIATLLLPPAVDLEWRELAELFQSPVEPVVASISLLGLATTTQPCDYPTDPDSCEDE